jgi:hypothetical protein
MDRNLEITQLLRSCQDLLFVFPKDYRSKSKCSAWFLSLLS